MHARLRQHREPIALPQPRRVERVQPHRPDDGAVHRGDGVQRVEPRVALVAVVLEQALVLDEHAAAHREVRVELRGTGGEPAGGSGERRAS